ncbi:MAG: DUF2007 domain-containing protein [bacterium]
MPHADYVAVFESSDYAEAALIFSALKAAGFVCEMLGSKHSASHGGLGGAAVPIRLIVPASRAADAQKFIRENEKN